LVDLTHAAKEIEDSLEESGLKDFCKSEFNLQKSHETGQIPYYVMLFEEAIAMSAEAGENSHKETVTSNYTHTNKVFPFRDMTRFHQIKVQARYVDSLQLVDHPEANNEDEDNEDNDSDPEADNDGNDVIDDDEPDLEAGNDQKSFKLTSRSIAEFPFGVTPAELLQERPNLVLLQDAIVAHLNTGANHEDHVDAGDLGAVEVNRASISKKKKRKKTKNKTKKRKKKKKKRSL